MINLFKVEYIVIQNGTEWKANIVAESRESVEAFLTNYLKTGVIIKSVSNEVVINGIADDIIEKIKNKYKHDIINEYLRENPREQIVEAKQEVIKPKEKVASKQGKKKSLRKK